ncbi:MAG: prenyltransferase [Methanomassiliicoccales archaeon]
MEYQDGSRWGTGRAFAALSRPQFLAATPLLYTFGALLSGNLDPFLWLLALPAVLLAHLQAHLANDYFDRHTDTGEGTFFSGGSGVLVQGRLDPRDSLLGEGAMIAGSLLLGLLVVLMGGSWPFLLVLATAIVMGVLYSAPPLRMVSTGLGEAWVGVMLGLLIPLSGFTVQAGLPGLELLLLCLPLVVLGIPTILGFELPDYGPDTRVGKGNLYYRLGLGRGKVLHSILLLLPYPMFIALSLLLGSQVLMQLLSLPVALYIVERLLRRDTSQSGVALQVATATAVLFVLASLLALFQVVV